MELVSSDSESDSELNEKNGRKNMNKGTKKKKAKGDEFVEDLADSSAPRGKSPLHSVQWERIILDEVISFLLPFLAKELGFLENNICCNKEELHSNSDFYLSIVEHFIIVLYWRYCFILSITQLYNYIIYTKLEESHHLLLDSKVPGVS